MILIVILDLPTPPPPEKRKVSLMFHMKCQNLCHLKVEIMLVPVQVQLELFREAKQAVLKPNYVDKYILDMFASYNSDVWKDKYCVICYIYP